MKKIIKVKEGDMIPDNAIYLRSVVDSYLMSLIVWHYFLVDEPPQPSPLSEEEK